MSLYYEAADFLKAPTNAGGSLKNRIFGKKELKSPPAQIYALVIETCKWSYILKEIIEHTSLLTLERKLTPVLSLLLVHDFLLAKKGIALPATHGLRASIERHKARLQAELTKARIRRKTATIEALREYVETSDEGTPDGRELPHPRWVRINTLKTTLDEQLLTLFADYEKADTINEVQERRTRRVYVDENIPNLVAIPAHANLIKSEAYKTGAIILQDKASCFPAYLLDPSPEHGDIMDTCAAPGNKTTHLAAILKAQAPESHQTIHAFEKNKIRAETLKKMTDLAGSGSFTEIHAGQDFMRVDPHAPIYKNVTALLLDPSCSGSGIVGRDDMPELHVPATQATTAPANGKGKPKKSTKKTPEAAEKSVGKRKRDDDADEADKEVMVDDDGIATAINSQQELEDRLASLSSFQLSLLQHAFSFPKARRITYSTCSIHAEENENVVQKALASEIAKKRGWRVLGREEQIKGMKTWPVRGDIEACEGEDKELIAEACIRANKGDGRGTMGFFVAAFVRDPQLPDAELVTGQDTSGAVSDEEADQDLNEDWNGFGDDSLIIEAAMPEVKSIDVAPPNGAETGPKKKRNRKKQRTAA